MEERVAVVLVEGDSDRGAVESLATRFGHAPERGSVVVVSMGGVTNISHYLKMYWKADRLAVLCDAREAEYVRRAVERHPDEVGVFVCRDDLEDELIRALGVEHLLDFLHRQGELAGFHTLQKQPDHRDSPIEQQLHRFMGIRSGRKIRYGRELTAELPDDSVPAPLADLLLYVLG
jgi:hypothetical protein